MNRSHLPARVVVACALAGVLTGGCNSIINGWLTPSELGSFTRETTLDIRGSLSIQDTPRGVRGAAEPLPEDTVPTVEDYRLIPGDVVNVFIYELRGPGAESAQQSVIDNQGWIDLPVVGWVKAAGLTARELEDELRAVLEERQFIYNADVLVQYAAQRGLTYTIFGNELLAVRLNRGPGVFPIPRPDFRLLDALSVSGGLSELVSEIYLFRRVARDKGQADAVAKMQASGDFPYTVPRTGARKPVDKPAPTPASADEEVVPPPPLPALAFSAGMSEGRLARLAGRRQNKEPPSSGGSKQEERPDAKVGGWEPPVAPESPDEGIPDSQEILDLMRSVEPVESTGDARRVPPEELAPELAVPPTGQPGEGGPTKFIMQDGKWVEVQPHLAPEEPAAMEEPAGPQRVVDWEAIAEEGQVIRPIRILPEALRQGDPRFNIVVRSGDVIRLYSGDIGFYYMTGHIRGPGVYSFRGGSTVTLKDAVAAAGGLDALAWPDRVTVYRRIGEREQMLQVNLDRIYAGVEADFYLKRDDIVNVGTHPVAPFLFQIRNFTIPQMGGSVAYFYRWIRQETMFSNEDLDAPDRPGLFP